MLKVIKVVLNKILSVFAVTDDRYTIKAIDETANEAGEVYCLTETATGKSWNIFARRYDGKYDLSSSGTKYVNYSIDRANRTSRNLPKVTFETVRDAKTDEPVPLEFDHHEALVAHLGGRDKVVCLYPPRPAKGGATPPNCALRELNA